MAATTRRVALPDFGVPAATPAARPALKTPPTDKASDPARGVPVAGGHLHGNGSSSSINFFDDGTEMSEGESSEKAPALAAASWSEKQLLRNGSDDADMSLSLSFRDPEPPVPAVEPGAAAAPLATTSHQSQSKRSSAAGHGDSPALATVDGPGTVRTIERTAETARRSDVAAVIDLHRAVSACATGLPSVPAKTPLGDIGSAAQHPKERFEHHAQITKADSAIPPSATDGSGRRPSAFPKAQVAGDPPRRIPGKSLLQPSGSRSSVHQGGRHVVQGQVSYADDSDPDHGPDDEGWKHAEDDEEENSFIDHVLPLHAPPPRPTQPIQDGTHTNRRSGVTPGRSVLHGESPSRASTPHRSAFLDRRVEDDPLESLLLRAQLRLREKERIESSSRGAASAASTVAVTPGSRAERTFHGNEVLGPYLASGVVSTPSAAEARRGRGRASVGTVLASPAAARAVSTVGVRSSGATPTRATFIPPRGTSLKQSDATAGMRHVSPGGRRGPGWVSEPRLQLENARLTEEMTYLTQENERLRHSGQHMNMAELTKLQLQVDALREELEDRAAQASRQQRQLEDALAEEKQHRAELDEQMRSYAASAEQYEQLLREKDAEIGDLQESHDRLIADARERQAGAARQREEVEHQRAAEREKVERTLALFEDAKRQRTHLMELNDKLQREKDQAATERRRVREELTMARAELQRAEDRRAQETDDMRRDVERAKGTFAEKERVLLAQLKEERRTSAILQERLAACEERTNDEVEQMRGVLRHTQDEAQRRSAQERDLRVQVEAALHKCEMENQRLSALLKTFTPEAKQEMESALRSAEQSLAAVIHERDCATLEVKRLSMAVSQQREEVEAAREEILRSTEMSRAWQLAKDKAETQCHQLSATLSRLMAQDDQQRSDNERLSEELSSIRQALAEAEHSASTAATLEVELGSLVSENERLSRENDRLVRERDDLVHENGALAEEMLKWRTEMRLILAQKSSGPAV